MSSRKLRRRGKSERRYTVLCDWCGENTETSREDTRTCGTRCRSRMSFYCRRMGYRPDHIIGPYTAQQAVDAEVGRLIKQERQRRQAIAAERAAYLARPGV
jgi:hypothetical protein